MAPPTAEAVAIVKAAIASVAPETEAELHDLDLSADVFDALGLDSMDHLSLMAELHRVGGAQVAERDYPAYRSVEALARLLT